MDQSTLFYDERFLESWAGPIITDPAISIIELVANCWDAYATEVNVTWPDTKTEKPFQIKDNGHGMTREEFQNIWRTIAYNRVSRQGNTIEPPAGVSGQPRFVFGKNGKGRFATFCFANEYMITSRKSGQEFTCRVYRTQTNPLVLEELSFVPNGVTGRGTDIVGKGTVLHIGMSEDRARELIGSRFLANPAFKVWLNKSQITFNDIPDLLSANELEIPECGTVKILHIDTKKADKTTKQHGIAWWVQGRAVGECRWSGSDYQRILDGRTSEAKRFTFIVQADYLNKLNALLDDWSWFRDDNEAWQTTRQTVQDKIRDIISDSSKTERDTKRSNVIERIGHTVNTLTLLSKERVETFVKEVVDNCPNFGEQEIVQLSTILANLEQAKSRYGLLEILHTQGPGDLDALHDVLTQWTIGMAKIVLDEIKIRLKLINELRHKIKVPGIDEVHELQPLFEKGLWMFGAQFESIEFTANRGMTTIIRELFGDKKGKGSRNRPDFVILPDSSVGFYSRSSYDENYDENGVEHVVIVDLKTTKLHIGSEEKENVWKWVKELRGKGYIRAHTKVDGFVLGDVIEPGEEEARKEGDNVRIAPLLYDVILTRAEKRLLNLYSKVQDAPFLVEQKSELQSFTDPIPMIQSSLI